MVVEIPDVHGGGLIELAVLVLLPPPAGVELSHVPPRHLGTLSAMLREPQGLDQRLLEHGRVITDSRNTVADDMARSQIAHRRTIVEALPAAFLVN